MNKTPFRLRPVPFKIILLLTRIRRHIVSEHLTAWLGVVFTLAVAGFTYKLAHVASMQTKILSRTDTALHLAATAQTDSAQTAERLRLFTEATERAWIGPSAAQSEPFEARKPVRITLLYNNTGRLLASYIFVNGGEFFTPEQWNDGTAPRLLKTNEQQCMSGLTNVPVDKIKRGIAYPTTGFTTYRMQYDSSSSRNTEAERFVISDREIGEHQIYLYFGCFVYQTPNIGTPHHSFFCFFINHLSQI